MIFRSGFSTPNKTHKSIDGNMSFDVVSLIQILNAVSAIAVVVGVVFVVFQLRQNARLIEASNRQIETANRQVEANIQQNKLQVVLSTIERFTDESFNLRRKKIRDIVKKSMVNDWKDFIESEDDYVIRGFISLYETTAYLVRMGITDIKTVAEGMGTLMESDWDALEPVVKHYREIWKRPDSYRYFEELVDSTKKLSKDRNETRD
jgi:hypothetical protein